MKQYNPPVMDVIEISADSVIMNTSGEDIHWETPRHDIWNENDPEEQIIF